MAWFSANWKYRVKLTVQSSKVEATETDIPVYVDLSDADSDFWSNVKSDGGDLIVTMADGITQQAIEVVAIDTGTDTGEIHFKASSLSSAVDTDFYVYYGNPGASQPAASSTYGSENVWPSNHKGVWHLNESGNGATDEFSESTSNGNDGTGGGGTASKTPAQVDGQMGKGQHGDGTDDYIDCATSSDYHFNRNDTYSISMWVDFDVLGAYEMLLSRIMDDGSTYAGWAIYKRDDNKLEWQNIYHWSTDRLAVYTRRDNLFSSWHHVVTTYNGNGDATGVKIYVDGVNEQLDIRYDTLTSDLSDTGRPLMLTGREVGGAQWNPLDGKIDEVRITNDVKPLDLILTEYNNQSSPSTFYAFGAQEASPFTFLPKLIRF
jgi:hypothetical protein